MYKNKACGRDLAVTAKSHSTGFGFYKTKDYSSAYDSMVGLSTSTPYSFANLKMARANFGFKSSGQYLK